VTQARAYLDHAASAPMLPEAREAWLAASEAVGNPSSLHTSGRHARRLVEESRESVAADLGVRPSEVIFTAGGTEADNLAVKGLAWAQPQRPRILCSTIEHHAVLDPVAWLGEMGREIDWLPVDGLGRVDPDVVRARLGDDVALCTVMWANNEVGTVQPVAAIAAACGEAGVAFHTDAVQALGQLPVDGALPGLSSLALSGQRVAPGTILNGDPVDRLPGNVHVSFPGCEGDTLLMLLDAAGVECSTGSACTAGVPEPSHVLEAMGIDPALARGSLRFSLGRTSTEADVDRLLEVLPSAVDRASRAAAPRLRRTR